MIKSQFSSSTVLQVGRADASITLVILESLWLQLQACPWQSRSYTWGARNNAFILGVSTSGKTNHPVWELMTCHAGRMSVCWRHESCDLLLIYNLIKQVCVDNDTLMRRQQGERWRQAQRSHKVSNADFFVAIGLAEGT